MTVYQKIKIEDDHFKKYFHEVTVSPQPCEEAKLLRQYLGILKQEDKNVVTKAHGKGPYYDTKYYKKTIGECSNSTVAAAKIKHGDDFPKKRKLDPELNLFPSYPVLVGCTACYKYMMVSSSNYACLKCHKRARTVEELNNK